MLIFLGLIVVLKSINDLCRTKNCLNDKKKKINYTVIMVSIQFEIQMQLDPLSRLIYAHTIDQHYYLIRFMCRSEFACSLNRLRYFAFFIFFHLPLQCYVRRLPRRHRGNYQTARYRLHGMRLIGPPTTCVSSPIPRLRKQNIV